MDSKNKLMLIVNPISGNSDKDNLLKQIYLEIELRKLVLLEYETTGMDDTKKIKQLVKKNHIRHILVAGGDGTIQLVAKAIHNLDISVGILPSGSANGLASSLNLTEDIVTQIDIALGKHSTEIDILSVNNQLCLHIADIGINAELIENYDKSSLRGKVGYALQTVPTLVSSDFPYKFKIEVNDKILEKEGILVAIANAKKFGTGAVVNPKGKINDGLFEVVIFKNLDIVNILETFDKNIDLDKEFMEFESTAKATITCKKPIALQIDGEYIGKTKKIEAKLLPNKLRVMIPKNFKA